MKHKNVKSRELSHEVLRVTNITFLYKQYHYMAKRKGDHQRKNTLTFK